MNKTFSKQHLGLGLIFVTLLLGCDNKFKFEQIPEAKLSTPKEPVITPPIATPIVDPSPTPTPFPEPPVFTEPSPTPAPQPSPEPIYNKTSGTCNPNSTTILNSCLNCVVPLSPAPPPQFSKKARELIEILNIGCSKNASAYGYKAPTRSQLENMMNRCSPTSYPDTIKSNSQSETIKKLLANDPSLVDKFFGKNLYYQPPYTDAFETYFGIENKDVQNILCKQNSLLSIPEVHSLEWYRSQNLHGNFHEKPEYIQAESYRKQLENCLKNSAYNPYVPPAPVPAKKCRFETLAGQNGITVSSQIKQWLKLGFKISIEVQNTGLCSNVTNTDQFEEVQGDVLVGAYICE